VGKRIYQMGVIISELQKVGNNCEEKTKDMKGLDRKI